MENNDLMARLMSLPPMTYSQAPPRTTPERTAAEALDALEEVLDTTPNLSDRGRRNVRKVVEGQVRDQIREHERHLVHQAGQFVAKTEATADEMAALESEIDAALKDSPASVADVYRRFERLQVEAGMRFQTASRFVEGYAGMVQSLEDPLAHFSRLQNKFPQLRRRYGV
ncbi:hypothetical protein ACH437_03765 [Streptomyces xinghaiensis]|uniref:hypothetical protein n=1 Tax=Streptomyces xinghaiensis TaxID=1038928 RepID=UPI0037A64D47